MFDEIGSAQAMLKPAPRGARGRVVLYLGRAHEAAHERVVHLELAQRLARLQGLKFLGEYRSSTSYAGRPYFVPADTVVGVEGARQLGIESENDLFGGVVPQSFIATKAISHPLLDPHGRIPPGWSADFGERVRGAVLSGFTVFTLADARRAGLQLLERGPVRIKSVRSRAGRGQAMAADSGELIRTLDGLDGSEVTNHGLVLEEHLEDVRTYSVGQVRVGDFVASYYGTQRLTEDNVGAVVYGGTDLVATRGGFDRLLTLDLPAEVRLAVTQAQIFDAAASDCFPGFLASRRNYDVASGLDAQAHRCSGVLEQSWRIGGASGAELAALEALQSECAPQVVRASSLETYGIQPATPPGATILFSGEDAEIGPITKSVLVESYGRK